MKRVEQRDFEALDYGRQAKAKLTAKQYLVYSYLMSISKWDSQDKESHYYVYKNSFVVNSACKLLGMTAPTWRAAIKKLTEEGYIYQFDKYYIIDIPNSYAPLHINLIKTLVQFGSQIRNGGHIVSVYSVLYKFWKYQIDNNAQCVITITQLKRLFGRGSNGEAESFIYKLMLGVFQFLGVLDVKVVKREYKGNEYNAYVIKNVKLELAFEENNEEIEPDDISEILEALNNSIK